MPGTFDPDFGTALEAAAAIRARQISSLELTEHTFRRIDAFQPTINAYVYQLRDEALAAARQADAAIARGGATGPLHGVPINVKESFGVRGQPCTWGMSELKDARPPKHSVAVRRLLDAGAILLGATNVPATLMDGQTFNDLYGVTNNPWDVTRTPGGSSGGSAASLAAGMAFLSIGSDIGGSIRTPASFCGIYGHKPTQDLVGFGGHLPGGQYSPPGFSTLMAVAGPMARSAADLAASLRVLAGPEPPDDKAFQWTMPKPRHDRLADYRVGYVLEDPAVPLSDETRAVLESAVRACERAGATLREGWPEGFSLSEMFDTYLFLLGAFDFSMTPLDARPLAREAHATRPPRFVEGALGSFADWQSQNLTRLGYRAQWERLFESIDVFLMPTTFTAAFPHDRTPPDVRTVTTPEGRPHRFWDFLTYIAPPTLTGCPATTAPAGVSRSGLPVGVQIVGSYFEDDTPITFAGLLAREIGGFQPPRGYDRVAVT
jgi:amidase